MKKKDIYREVTAKIIESLENNNRPWEAPYNNQGIIPLRSTGENYRGINTVVLMMTAHNEGYTSPYWFTFNQAKALGAHVKKGELSTSIVFYKKLVLGDDDSELEDTKTIPMLKTYNVFNACQIDGLSDKYTHITDEGEKIPPIARCETFFGSIEANLVHKNMIPNYNPATDTITCPSIDNFKTSELYYATLGHEFGHWTGSKKRLDRLPPIIKKRSDSYYFEELVAELTAGFLMPLLGVKSLIDEEHAPYIKSYLRLLKDDEKMIFKASAQAQKAVDYLFSLSEGV